MKYRSGYKYITAESAVFFTTLEPKQEAVIDNFVTLTTDGLLIIGKGYAWNGMNWWSDTKKNMKASLVHDALYQLIQEGLLPLTWKQSSDETFRDMLIAEEDISAHLCYFAVKTFGDRFIRKPIQILEV